MFRKLALGLVAAASLSGGWGGGWGGWGFHHHHIGLGLGYIGGIDGGCYVTRLVETPFGLRYRTVNVCVY